MEVAIPPSLAANVHRFRGADGSGWIYDLSGIVDELRGRWGLTLGEPFPYSTINYVAPAEREDGAPCVLKVGFLLDELADEMRALRVCAGSGAVRLLECLPEKGAMLLERAIPGSDLSVEADDERACEIGAAAMLGFWRPASEAPCARTVADWARGLERMRRHYRVGGCPISGDTVARAERTFEEMAQHRDEVLLHGDFHHFNILRAERAPWLVVDPKGVTGMRAYEVGPFIANRCDRSPDLDRSLSVCLGSLSRDLGLDRSLLAECTLAHAVLSAWWSIEDGGGCDQAQLKYIEAAARAK